MVPAGICGAQQPGGVVEGAGESRPTASRNKKENMFLRFFRPDVRGKGSMTPLHYAVQQGQEDVVRALLRYGADPNLQNTSGNSALHMACTNLSHALVELLMDSGSDPNLQNKSVRGKDDLTSLHYAVQRSQEDTVRVLLRHGADPNIQNEIGLSALHMACDILTHALVQLLMDSGADPGIKDNCGIKSKGHCHNEESLERLLTRGKGTARSCRSRRCPPNRPMVSCLRVCADRIQKLE